MNSLNHCVQLRKYTANVCSHPMCKAQRLSFRTYFPFRFFIPFLSVLFAFIQLLMAPECGMLAGMAALLQG